MDNYIEYQTNTGSSGNCGVISYCPDFMKYAYLAVVGNAGQSPGAGFYSFDKSNQSVTTLFRTTNPYSDRISGSINGKYISNNTSSYYFVSCFMHSNHPINTIVTIQDFGPGSTTYDLSRYKHVACMITNGLGSNAYDIDVKSSTCVRMSYTGGYLERLSASISNNILTISFVYNYGHIIVAGY